VHNLKPDSGVTDRTLRDILVQKIPKDTRAFAIDMAEWHRMKDSDPLKTHDWLLEMFDRHIKRMADEALEQSRSAQFSKLCSKSGGQDYNAGDPALAAAKGGAKGKGKDKNKPKKEARPKKTAADRAKEQREQERGRKAEEVPPLPPGDPLLKVCYFFQLGTCDKTAEQCRFTHTKISPTDFAKIPIPRKRSRTPAPPGTPKGNGRGKSPKDKKKEGKDKKKEKSYCSQYAREGKCDRRDAGKECDRKHFTQASIDKYNEKHGIPKFVPKAKPKGKAKGKKGGNNSE